jgi:hypothetical protein
MTISSVEIMPETKEPPDEFLKSLTNLKGTNFAAETLSGVMKNFTLTDVPSVRGIRLSAIRNDDLTGVHLVVRISHGEHPAGRCEWNFSHGGRIGVAGLGSSSGYFDSGFPTDTWDSFTKEIAKHLDKVTPETPFEIRASISPHP